MLFFSFDQVNQILFQENHGINRKDYPVVAVENWSFSLFRFFV